MITFLTLKIADHVIWEIKVSMAKTEFSYTLYQLKSMSEDMLTIAKKQGASAAEVDVSLSIGQSVSVRLGETENIEYNLVSLLSILI